MSTEGLVEHQKRNQTATFQLVVGFVFVVELAYRYRLEVPPPKVSYFIFSLETILSHSLTPFRDLRYFFYRIRKKKKYSP